MRMLAATGVLTLAVAMIGCSDSTAPRAGAPQPGVLQLAAYAGPETMIGDPTVAWSVEPGVGVLVPGRVLIAPDTVDAGVAFDVTVTTIGVNGCWRAGGQTVAVAGGVVDLLPTDVHSGADVCTEMVGFLAHTSPVTIDAPGEWTLRVSGRRMRHGDAVWQEPVTVERGVYVR